jgi:hypothetical protein
MNTAQGRMQSLVSGLEGAGSHRPEDIGTRHTFGHRFEDVDPRTHAIEVKPASEACVTLERRLETGNNRLGLESSCVGGICAHRSAPLVGDEDLGATAEAVGRLPEHDPAEHEIGMAWAVPCALPMPHTVHRSGACVCWEVW